MSFDDAINDILKEQYFGGAPFEQASGIKKHITYESAADSLGSLLQKKFKEQPPYYSRDKEDKERWPDHTGGKNKLYPDGQYVENPNRIDYDDSVVEELLGDADLIKVDVQEGGTLGDIHVYTLRDERIIDSLKPYALIAHSHDDHGMDAKLGPLDQWTDIHIGHKMGDRLGSFVNHDGDLIRRNKPVLKDKGGEGGRIYTGPAKNLKDLSNKEPAPREEPSSSEPEESPSGGFKKAMALAKGIDFSKYR